MSEKNRIFREKSLERISSPEDLDKYIKTTTPSVWLLLVSIIILLVGVICWSVFGSIKVTSNIGVNVSGKNGLSYIKEEDFSKVSLESYIDINDKQYAINSVDGPFQAKQANVPYLLHAAEIEEDDWYYEVKYNTDLNNGDYKGTVVFDTISPITFIIN